MANDPIDGIRQKLVRAEKHLADVLDILHTYSKGHCKLVPERDEELNALVLRVHLSPKSTPALSALIGDYLFAVRCVLDYLVWGMVERAGATPTKRTMFPITPNEDGFNGAIGRHQLDGVPVDAVAIIKSLQPHNGRNQALGWLDRLHNIDKHRMLNVTILASSHTSFVWGDGGFQTIFGAEELHDGAILPAGVPLDNPAFTDLVNRLYEVKVEGECALFVAFKELSLDGGDLEDASVAVILHEISEFIRCDVLPVLCPFLD